MQACRGRRDGTGLAGVHRLVAFAVGSLSGTLDVGRQRHLAEPLEDLVRIAAELHAPEIILARHDGGCVSQPQGNHGAGSRRLARAQLHERRARTREPLEHDLDLAAAVALDAMQARRDHSRVVEDQQVAGAQKRRQVDELAIGQRTCGTLQVQQPAAAARGGRMAGDQFVGQVEMEVGAPHQGAHASRGDGPCRPGATAVQPLRSASLRWLCCGREGGAARLRLVALEVR